MSKKVTFTTPRLFIADYYDALINRIDIYTEKLIARYGEEDILPNEPDEVKIESIEESVDTDELCGEKYHQDEYLSEYNYDHIERRLDVEPGVTKVRDYINQVRARQIDEIRKVQEHNLDMYEMNKKSYRINKREMDEWDLEDLKNRLFADKFCFLIEIDEINSRHQNNCIFKFYTVITDFYMTLNVLDILESLTNKYIYGLVAKQKYGFEVISLNKQSLKSIEKVFLNQEHNGLIYLNSNRIGLDVSAIKSLHLFRYDLEFHGLDAFSNLEYLSLSKSKLRKSWMSTLNFNKLIKLKLFECDLRDSPDLDLSNLNQFKWLELQGYRQTISYLDLEIKNLCESLICLKVVNFFINMKWDKWITSCPNLKCLWLENIWIYDLSFLACESLSNLEDLNLSSNQISTIKQENLSKVVNLKRLVLNGHYMLKLPARLFRNLSNLEELSLRDSKFNEEELKIDKDAFFGLTNLISLDLANNHITELDPAVFFHTPNLVNLNLENNPIKIVKDVSLKKRFRW